jgi:hypothetical protein
LFINVLFSCEAARASLQRGGLQAMFGARRARPMKRA